MKDHFQIVGFLLRIRLVVFFFIFYFGCDNFSYAQDKGVKPLPIDMTDTLTFSKEQKGIFNKLAQALKFRENRNKREKERTYKFILELINDRDLSIDSNMNEILKMIDTLNNADAIKFKGLDQKILITNEAIDSLRAIVIDSFEVAFSKALDSVFEKRMEKYFTDQSKIDNFNETSLNKLRDIDCSCAWLDKQDENVKKEIGECIETKVKIIGWHNQWNKLKYENYDYRYLSALNLYGYYELGSDGMPKIDNNLKELNDRSIIDFSKSKNAKIDFYLTVHNSNSNEISNFLENSMAQKNLIEQLYELCFTNEINGVNIYFEQIKEKDADKFNYLITQIYKRFESIENYHINITIPAIYDEKSLVNSSVYNFPELNPIVNQYFISTDRMIRYDNDWAQPNSPLNSSDKPEFGSIVSNVNFYRKKIPSNKLIVSVSYLGQEWPVTKSFNGKVSPYPGNSISNDIEYSEILRAYKNNKNFSESIEEGYDSIQKSAYLNVTDSYHYFEPKYYQIWYENQKSLMSKYQWILENDLAGVSIRGLGYDDGYNDLWDAIGSTLIKIESRPEVEEVTKKNKKLCQFDLFRAVDSIKTKYLKFIKKDTILESKEYNKALRVIYSSLYEKLEVNSLSEEDLLNSDLIKIRIESIFDKYIDTNIFGENKWSRFSSIQSDSKESIWHKFQWYPYKTKNNSINIGSLFQSYGLYSDYKWASEPITYYKTEHTKAFLEGAQLEKGVRDDYEGYLEDEESCFCLYQRAIMFSKIGFSGAGFCLILYFILLGIANYCNRFQKGGKSFRLVIRILRRSFGILTVTLLFFALFMSPYYSAFGASNDGGLGIGTVFIILIFGIILGTFLYSRYARARYIRKDLP